MDRFRAALAVTENGVVRSVPAQLAGAGAVIALGLLSRSHRVGLPRFWAKYSGDALWALLVFLLWGAALRHRSTRRVAVIAFAYACATEFSQLIHTPWLDRIRRNPIGHLVLGDTFAWPDMAAYLVGVSIGAGVELAIAVSRNRRLRQAAP